MSSPIDICNQALAHIGDRRITRLDDDAAISDAVVRYCAEFYPTARQEVMAAQRWTFAKHVALLSRRLDSITVGFAYSHQLPNDLMRLMEVYPAERVIDPSNPQPTNTAAASQFSIAGQSSFASQKIDQFKIVGRQLWTNYSGVAVGYIRDVENPSEWTPHFRAAVARLLASYLAGAIADNPDENAKQKRIYETIDLPNAQFYDAIQDGSGENSNHETRLAQSKSLQARYSTNYGQSDNTDFSF